ncbi:transcription termination/antitermination protein NusA [bacterium]|nr:transcription termination/antitermination protein NusA [bacterium]
MKLHANFSAFLQEIETTRGVPRARILEALVEGLRAAYEKSHGPTSNLEVEINLPSSEIEAFLSKVVVEQVNDSLKEISLKDARQIDKDADLDDTVLLQADITELGNLAVHTFKQRVKSLIREAEREKVLELYGNRLFEMINCSVLYTERGDIYVETPDKIEGIIPYKEQIPRERPQPYQRIKCLLTEVRNVRKAPMLVFSRAHNDLLRELMANEIPEVREGNIEIVAIARDPGYRSKVAVRSKLPELDPVGSCIGSRGIRITAISHDLNDEKIDLVLYKEDPFEFIAEALSPAKVLSVEIFEDERRGVVVVPDDQISLAIGKGWRNVKLASKLTRYYLDVKSVSEINAEQSKGGAKSAAAGQREAPVEVDDDEQLMPSQEADIEDTYIDDQLEEALDGPGDQPDGEEE